VSVAYLIILLVTIGCMMLLDWRHRLFFWVAPLRAAVVLTAGVLFFLVWDLFGIGLDIFYRGETSFMTGLQIAPELPLEEVFFLIFLCYLTMNLVAGVPLFLANLNRQDRARRTTRSQGNRNSA
jgi:lycopene cyclase domain-containing protein